MPTREKLTIAVPCLNEERNIEDTVRDIRALTDELDLDHHVYLIDDGSTDGTLRRMREFAEQDERLIVRSNERCRGAGASVMALYDELDPESWFTALPGDNEIVAASMHNHFAVRGQYDVILSYLHNPVIRPAVRRLASAVFQSCARLAYGFPYRYLNGPKLYRVRAFRGISVVGRGSGFNAELLAKATLRDPTLRVGEVPFVARGRAAGQSKVFSPRAVTRAASEFVEGYRSVVSYREEQIRSSDGPK